MERQIFITMDGGLIQDINVSADLSDVEITVVDFDIDGTRMDIKKTPDGDAAIIDKEPVQVISDGDLEFWEQILARRNK